MIDMDLETYFTNLSDDEIKSVISHGRDELEERRNETVNLIPKDKLEELMDDGANEFLNRGKLIEIELTVKVPVTIQYEDGEPYPDIGCHDYGEIIFNLLEDHKQIPKEVKKAKKEFKAFKAKIRKLAKKSGVDECVVWDELEVLMYK